MMERRARRRWRAAAVGLVMLALACPAAAPRSGGAQETGGLYQTTVIVTGYDMRNRPAGFAQALREVLVKASGEPRLTKDPRVSELARRAGTLVTSFDYVDQMAGIKHKDDQGTYDRPYNLTVHFDPARIDKALAALGEHPWRGRRPVVVPVIAVRSVGASYLLSAEAPAAAGQRDAFAGVASEYAMKVRIPSEADLAAWHVTAGTFPAPPPAASPDQAVVAGTLEFQPAIPGWVGAWKMRWRGTDYAWGIRGVNFDEAFRDVIRGVVRVASGHGGPN